MHQILHKRCPSYLADLVTFNTAYSQRRHLRSSTTRSTAVRRLRNQFGKRAFSVSGPIVWNSLPTALRYIDSYPVFRRRALCFFLIINCLSHSFTDIVMHSRPYFVDWALEHCIVLYCIVRVKTHSAFISNNLHFIGYICKKNVSLKQSVTATRPTSHN